MKVYIVTLNDKTLSIWYTKSLANTEIERLEKEDRDCQFYYIEEHLVREY